MTRYVALKTPCPLCQGRLTAVVRRMPLLGWHMVGLACEHGCDIRWFNRDAVSSRSWYPTAESCVEHPDGFLSDCVEYLDTLFSTECPKCGERPQIKGRPLGAKRFPSVSCRCASEWGADLCEAARKWAYATGVYWQCLNIEAKRYGVRYEGGRRKSSQRAHSTSPR